MVGSRGGRRAGERGARDSSFFIHPSSFVSSLPGCGAKRPCRSSGLRRGCRSARPKGPSPCSLIWLRAKTNAKPQEPSNPAPSSNSNLRFDPFLGTEFVSIVRTCPVGKPSLPGAGLWLSWVHDCDSRTCFGGDKGFAAG